MTVFIDPVIGAALVAGLLPILPGLPCPTCRGTGWRCRNSNLMCTHRVHQGCEDCTGSGVWTPPDHPVTIGVTSATADAMLDQDERMHEAGYDIGIISDQRSGWELATRPPGEEWTSGNTIKHPIVLSSVIGEATLRKLKVVEATIGETNQTGEVIWIRNGWFGHDLDAQSKDPDTLIDISSALPFLPGLKPDDTVYLLDGFTESVEWPKPDERCPVGHPEEGNIHCGHWWDCGPCCRCGDDTVDPYCDCDRCTAVREERGDRTPCPFSVDAPDHPCVQP